MTDVIPEIDQTNASLKVQINYGLNGFDILRDYTRGDFLNKIWHFLESHPDKNLMLPRGEQMSAETRENLVSIAETLASGLYDMIHGQTISERLSAFRRLKNHQVFQKWVGPEFLSQLIPPERLKDVMQVSIEYSSDEVPLRYLTLGNNGVTPAYEAVQFLRNTINDRSLDLRLDDVERMGEL